MLPVESTARPFEPESVNAIETTSPAAIFKMRDGGISVVVISEK